MSFKDDIKAALKASAKGFVEDAKRRLTNNLASVFTNTKSGQDVVTEVKEREFIKLLKNPLLWLGLIAFVGVVFLAGKRIG